MLQTFQSNGRLRLSHGIIWLARPSSPYQAVQLLWVQRCFLQCYPDIFVFAEQVAQICRSSISFQCRRIQKSAHRCQEPCAPPALPIQHATGTRSLTRPRTDRHLHNGHQVRWTKAIPHHEFLDRLDHSPCSSWSWWNDLQQGQNRIKSESWSGGFYNLLFK